MKKKEIFHNFIDSAEFIVFSQNEYAHIHAHSYHDQHTHTHTPSPKWDNNREKIENVSIRSIHPSTLQCYHVELVLLPVLMGQKKQKSFDLISSFYWIYKLFDGLEHIQLFVCALLFWSFNLKCHVSKYFEENPTEN